MTMRRSISPLSLALLPILQLIGATVARAESSSSSPATSGTMGFENINNFSDFVTVFWAWASHIIFTLSVLTIITGGVVYVASAGAQEKVDAAKEIIKGAVVSIILVIISGSAINMLIDKPAAGASAQNMNDSFKMLNNTSSMIIGLAGGFTVLMVIVNGIRYITAAGDEDKIASARKGLSYAVIGLGICLTAYLVVRNVVSIF